MSELRAATGDRERDRYVEHVIRVGSAISLPELRRHSLPDALYRVRDRGGLGVAALPERALDEGQLDALARFRFAQYLAAGFIDRDVAFRRRLDHDVLADASTYRSADTIHFIAYAESSRQLVASMCLLGPPRARPGVRVRDRDRPLFPVEEQFGWGAFVRLAVAPDTPVDRVREFGRLVKCGHPRSAATGPRAVLELVLAASRLLVRELSAAVDLCVGEFETNSTRRVFEFFHAPMAVLEGGLPAFAPGHPLNAALDRRDRYPFAFLVADLPSIVARWDAIEAALATPDPDGVAALVTLQQIRQAPPSTLIPVGGVPALANTTMPQRSLPLPARRRARELGAQLRRFPPFARLSDTECTTLRTFAAEAVVEPGRTIVSSGQVAGELVLVEDGRADLHVRGRPARAHAGPGDCIGLAGVLAGAPSEGDVVARTEMRLVRLPADPCLPLLRELPDVELELHRHALASLAWNGSQPRTPRSAAHRRLATNSAEAMAALRAAGAAERDPAIRNPDYLAGAFLTLQPRVHALAKVAGVRRVEPTLAERLLPGGYHYETARVKHIDAVLDSELCQGLDQLVLLGAGYDTRPYRFAPSLRDTRVYEVDLPAISHLKRRKAARVLGRTPEHVHFIAADFTHYDVYARLHERGYDLDGATLIILSGVTPYLPGSAVSRLFAFAERHRSPRTSIVFDYVFREMVEGDDGFHGAAQVRKRLEALGEPLQFGIPAGGIMRFLGSFGLTVASDVQPDELAARYLRRTDGRIAGRPYGFAAIAHARPDPVRGAPSPDSTGLQASDRAQLRPVISPGAPTTSPSPRAPHQPPTTPGVPTGTPPTGSTASAAT
jgi:methyltransferase (TIGR00027 family)